MDSLNKVINKKSMIYYSLCVVCIIAGYMSEFLRGLKSIEGLIVLLFICLIPLTIAIIKYIKRPENRGLTTFIGIAFTIGYVYVLLTFTRLSVYVLVLIMLPILTLNAAKKSIYSFTIMILLANVVRIIMQYMGVIGNGFDPLEHFIQICALVLVFICNIGTNTISLMYNKQQVHALYDEKANQQKAISKTNSIMNIVRGYSNKFSTLVGNLTKYSKDVSHLTNTTNESALYGSLIVDKISVNSDSVSHSSAEVGKAIGELKLRVDKINETIGIISKISDEINILSLNAAVESARSGEAGLGFGVVAEEIKNLANETAKSTKYINEIINQLNNDVENSVEAMAALDKVNDQQNKLIEDVALTYSKISNSMGDVADKVVTMNDMISSVSDSNQMMLKSMEK